MDVAKVVTVTVSTAAGVSILTSLIVAGRHLSILGVEEYLICSI